MLRLVLQAVHETQGIELPAFIQAFVDINWLYFSFLLFVFTCARDLRREQVHAQGVGRAARGPDLQVGDRRAERARTARPIGFWEIFHTCVIVGIIAGIYIYFW